jgi:putative ABC transport system permease protein
VALFVMIIRKMVQNKWLVASLLIGLVMSVALVSSMPIYSEAVLSRMLVKDLEQMQEKRGVYPGSQYNRLFFSKETPEQISGIYMKLNGYMQNEGKNGFGIPVQHFVTDFQSKSLKIQPRQGNDADTRKSVKTMTLRSFSGLEEHITLKDGRMPAAVQPVDGVYEVLVTERALIQFKTVLDAEFVTNDDKIAGEMTFKPVGIFAKTRDDDPYFRDANLNELTSSFVISDETATRRMLQESQIPLAAIGWFNVLDYSKLELRHVEGFVQHTAAIRGEMLKAVTEYQAITETPALDTIAAYLKRAEQLGMLMWSLNVPVLIMLGFYMFMVANLIADRQKNEIAVLRSRGAARWQIVASYAVEGLLLCAAAFGLGPLLGALLTEVLCELRRKLTAMGQSLRQPASSLCLFR